MVSVDQQPAGALAGFSPDQIASARQLIEDRAIVPATRPGVWVCVSTDGTQRYFADYGGCSCPAKRRCYHQLAARMMNAAKYARRAA